MFLLLLTHAFALPMWDKGDELLFPDPLRMTPEQLASHAATVYPKYIACRDATITEFDASTVTTISIDTAVGNLTACAIETKTENDANLVKIRAQKEELSAAQAAYARLTDPSFDEARATIFGEKAKPLVVTDEASKIVTRARTESGPPPADQAITKALKHVDDAEHELTMTAKAFTVSNWVVTDANAKIAVLAEARTAIVHAACFERSISPASVNVTCGVSALSPAIRVSVEPRRDH